MNEKSVSTLGRIASVLGVASKHTKTLTPIETILRMQHFQIWGFILMILAVAIIIWLIQKKLDSIDKQYKEQFILLHRLFKSHQDLQIKVHKNNQQQPTVNVQPVVAPPPTPNVFIPVIQQPQVVVVDVLDTIKEESVDDSASIATVETLDSSVSIVVDHNESVDHIDPVESIDPVVEQQHVDQKVVEVDDSLPDMFN
jgi:hypothetical protein